MAAYLLIGEAPSAEFATRLAEQYKVCPHVHFIAAFGTMLVSVWYLPETKRWWLEMVAAHPQVSLGLLRAAVYRTERPSYPEAPLRRAVASSGPLAPCGSDCRVCDRASADEAPCPGCPALVGEDAESGDLATAPRSKR
jgi:hypothetical protein